MKYDSLFMQVCVLGEKSKLAWAIRLVFPDIVTYITDTMTMSGILLIYTLTSQACGPKSLGVYISKIPYRHGVTITDVSHSLSLKAKILESLVRSSYEIRILIIYCVIL